MLVTIRKSEKTYALINFQKFQIPMEYKGFRSRNFKKVSKGELKKYLFLFKVNLKTE